MTTAALAQIIGPILIAVTVGFIANPKSINAIMKDVEKNEGSVYFIGIVVMIIGLLIINNHNIWELSAAGLITLMGWGAAIKGATFLIAPKFLFKMSKPVLSCPNMMKFAMAIWLLAGGYLSYVGYLA